MNLILDDNKAHLTFAPLTLTRPVAELRMGILTQTERYKKWLPEATVYYATVDYLAKKYKGYQGDDGLVINAQIIPNEELVGALVALEDDVTLTFGNTWIARKGKGTQTVKFIGQEPIIIEQRWDLYQKNDEVLVADYFLLTGGRTTAQLSPSNTVIGNRDLIFLEEGAQCEGAILNTTAGPIYLAKDAEIMEGSLVRGPFSLGEHAVLKMGTKVYGATTIGPECRIGGEVSNVIFQGYSNKGHDGFLGNALVGEWCNFGADSNTSNLKNNYSPVRAYSYETMKEEETGQLFMGVCMGDHSKCGINTMFNTATVVGVSCNIYGGGFPKKYIPSFSWGGNEGWTSFEWDKALEAANAMMARRGLNLSPEDVEILNYLYSKQ